MPSLQLSSLVVQHPWSWLRSGEWVGHAEYSFSLPQATPRSLSQYLLGHCQSIPVCSSQLVLGKLYISIHYTLLSSFFFFTEALPSLRQAFFFPRFSYRLIIKECRPQLGWRFRWFLAKSLMSFLFLKCINGWHPVVNSLYLLLWGVLFIVDLDYDMPSSWRMCLT